MAKATPKAEISPAPEKHFDITFNEIELNFITNAVFGVQINSKDAKFISDLQSKLVTILTGVPPSELPVE